jgi:dihydroflavonol-4-reductase
MILVTGATGHIGNVLVRKLIEKGEQVRIFALPADNLVPLEDAKVDVARGDTRDYAAVRAACEGIDVVYHLAAIITILPGKQPHVFDVNVNGTRNVIKACRETGVKRLVYTSSIHALKRIPHGTKVDETVPFDPDNPFGAYDQSKAQATLEVLEAVKSGLDAVVLCPTGVIGPYDFSDSLMGGSLRAYATMEKVSYIPGGYDFVDVRDVADGIITAAQKGRTGEAYLLSGEYISNKDLSGLVLKLLGKDIPVNPVPLWLGITLAYGMPLIGKLTGKPSKMTPYAFEVLQSNADISHAKATGELDYNPRALSASVADSLTWYKEHGLI